MASFIGGVKRELAQHTDNAKRKICLLSERIFKDDVAYYIGQLELLVGAFGVTEDQINEVIKTAMPNPGNSI
jgi:hypothetical protein